MTSETYEEKRHELSGRSSVSIDFFSSAGLLFAGLVLVQIIL